MTGEGEGQERAGRGEEHFCEVGRVGKDHIRSNLYCEVRAIHHIPETQLRILNFILSAKERKTMAWSDLFLTYYV